MSVELLFKQQEPLVNPRDWLQQLLQVWWWLKSPTCWFNEWIVSSLMSLLATIRRVANRGSLKLKPRISNNCDIFYK